MMMVKNFDWLIIAFLIFIVFFAVFLWLSQFAFNRSSLKARMKNITIEKKKKQNSRNKIAFLSNRNKKKSLRVKESKKIEKIVESFDLRRLLVDEGTVLKLHMAGYRNPAHLTYFLFFRFFLPFLFVCIALFIFLISNSFQDYSFNSKLLTCIFFGYAGFYAPVFFVKKKISNRMRLIKISYPDALDLMLICVRSGLSVEATLKKIADEIAPSAKILSDELSLTNAELSFLPERRQAYENLARRTNIESIKATTTALIQADQYGTAVADSLKVVCEESREARKAEIEKKAAALPPMLTVPMILFFLPALFAVIIGPAIIQVIEKDLMGG